MKVGGSHALMILISFWTAVTFAAYFSYAPEFVVRLFSGEAAQAAYITVVVLTITTYLAAGVIREHVCTMGCPYARFQGVMYEADTLAVSYDARRGEGTAGRIIPKAGLKTREERLVSISATACNTNAFPVASVSTPAITSWIQ